MTDPASGVGIFAALAAGMVSFLSPCVLPLVPGYLSAVIGVSPADLKDTSARRVLVPSLLFIASFSTIFILLGLSATAIGSTLRDHQALLEKIAGAFMITMGLFFLATPFVLQLNREFRVDGLIKRAGRGGPLMIGAAFAVAWTPCVGPTLGAVLAAAALSGSAAHGALLLGVYSAGLAIPFLATALAFGKMTTAFGPIKRHFPVVIGVGGAVLVTMGVLVFTGELFQLNIKAQELLDSIGLNFFNSV